MSITEQFMTHDVQNQPTPLRDYNVWEVDTPLREAVEREGGGWAADHLSEYGARAGSDLLLF